MDDDDVLGPDKREFEAVGKLFLQIRGFRTTRSGAHLAHSSAKG
jgi:hypothetical protein